jgi:hypothetical protein
MLSSRGPHIPKENVKIPSSFRIGKHIDTALQCVNFSNTLSEEAGLLKDSATDSTAFSRWLKGNGGCPRCRCTSVGAPHRLSFLAACRRTTGAAAPADWRWIANDPRALVSRETALVAAPPACVLALTCCIARRGRGRWVQARQFGGPPRRRSVASPTLETATRRLREARGPARDRR